MLIRYFLALIFGVVCSATTWAGGKLVSGPQKGELLPRPFHSLNINGAFGKYEEFGIKYSSRYHSLVCEYGLRPVVMVFAHEDPTEMDTELLKLLQGLDQAVEEDPDSALRAFVVFLSPGARTSATEATLPLDQRIMDPLLLNTEALMRDKLLARLEKRAANLKKVIVSALPPEGPQDYKLADKAEITIILYKNHRVLENFAFAAGEFNEAAVTTVLDSVRAMAGLKKKVADPK